ncbi:MAG: 4Fe-4S binding protein [Gammaproteobacteria bacterium]
MSLSPLAVAPADGRITRSRVARARARITRRNRLSHDTWELGVELLPGEAPIHAEAGQFATLHVAGLERPRAYSFARDPALEPPGAFTFFVREVPGGAMSGWLAGGDRVGAEVGMAAPLGRFVLDRSDGPMLVIAGGSGMSAVKAIVERAARLGVQRDCVFLYGARTAADLYAADAVEACRARWHPQHSLDFVQVLSEEPADSGWNGPRGFVTDYLREAYLDRRRLAASALSAWLCGPPPMVDAALGLLRDYGVRESNVHRDLFEDASAPAPAIDNRRCVLCDECLLVRPVDGCIVEASLLAADGEASPRPIAPIEPGHTAGLYYNALAVDPERCIRCLACVNACPHGAIVTGAAVPARTLGRHLPTASLSRE